MVLYVCRARPGHMPSYAALASGAEDSGRRALVEATLDLSGAFNFGQFLQGAPAREFLAFEAVFSLFTGAFFSRSGRTVVQARMANYFQRIQNRRREQPSSYRQIFRTNADLLRRLS